jgi:hypothetical protein
VTDEEVELGVQNMLKMAKSEFEMRGSLQVAYLIFTPDNCYFVINADASKEAFLQAIREQCLQLKARGLIGVFKGWSSEMPLGLTVHIKEQPDAEEAVMGVLEDSKLGHRLYTAKIAPDRSVGEFVVKQMSKVMGAFANVLTKLSDLN